MWESIIRAVIEYNPTGKRPLGKYCLRWEDYIMRDVGKWNLEYNREKQWNTEIDGGIYVWRVDLKKFYFYIS